jgi:protoporphyrinogen oxidase
MRVAVIGAGMTGLVAALRLTRAGHECDVYERWPGLGGQVATLDLGDGALIERYYHHLFTTDVHIQRLYEEVGMPDAIQWLPSSVAVFAAGRSHPFTTPVDLLRFSPLPLASRLRMGLAVLLLQRRHQEVDAFEEITAREWIEKAMGRAAWKRVWGPLLRGKFGNRAEDISMAWLWSKLTLRRRIEGKEARGEVLGYPQGGWQPLLERLREEIESSGSRVLIDRPAARIAKTSAGRFGITAGAGDSFRRGHDPRQFAQASEQPEEYDAVIATVPNDVFAALLDPSLAGELEPGYLDKLESIDYHTALCLLLVLDRQFTPFYWTNVADNELPFVGLIEQTNFIEPAVYGGRRLLYVANYVEPDDELLSLDPDELVDRYTGGLQRVNPDFDRSWVRERWLFREPAAQPIVTVGYQRRMPPLATGVKGLILANTTQIYPEDRGTNYSVRLADQAVEALVRKANGAAPSTPG